MRRLQDAVLAGFPALVVFALIPLLLYVPNQRDLDFKLALLYPFLGLAAAAWLALGLLVFVHPRRERWVNRLFYLGLYLLAADAAAPWLSEPRFDRLGDALRGYLVPVFAEIALAVAAIYLARRFPVARFRGPAALFVVLLCAVQAFTAVGRLSGKTQVTSESVALSPPPSKLAQQGNVYQITFDEFTSHEFARLLEDPSTREEFEGFTFFRNNRSNYVFTWVSVASFMTGSLLAPDALERWMNRWKEEGVLGHFYDAGYQISTYVPDRSWVHRRASHVVLASAAKDAFSINLWRFADLWSSRILPNLLHPLLFENEQGPLSHAASRWFVTRRVDAIAPSALRVLRQLIEDEAGRPGQGQYVYAHAYLPHFPYVLDADCRYGRSDYHQQSLCALRIMREFIATLKHQGKYDSATIVLQSDHGNIGWVRRDLETRLAGANGQTSLAKGLADELREVNYKSEALLLIKPPNAPRTKIKISPRHAQLGDLPRTLSDITGTPVPTEVGISLFAHDFPRRREIHVYKGFDQFIDGRRVRFGQSIFEANWSHFIHVEGEGWRVMPPFPVRWR